MKALFALVLAVSLVVVACQGETVVEVLPTPAPWPTHTPYPTLAPAADTYALPHAGPAADTYAPTPRTLLSEPDALSYAGGRRGQMGRLPQRDFESLV